MRDVSVTINTQTFFHVFAFVIFLVLVYVIRDVLLLVFISLMFAAVISPLIDFLKKWGMPRSVSAILIYIVGIGVFALVLTGITPLLLHDLPQFFVHMTSVWDSLQKQAGFQQVLSVLLPQGLGSGGSDLVTQQLGDSFGKVLSTVTGFFGGILSVVLVFVMTFYMSVQQDPIGKIIHSFVPEVHELRIRRIVMRIQEKLRLWLRAQVVLGLCMSVMVTIGLLLLNVKYALVLGLIAGLLEFIPYVGPIISAIPGLLLGFTQGGMVLFVCVLGLYIIAQQTESHVLVPKVMQRAVGLNPIVSIVAVLIGVKIAGIPGALLAIPVATTLSVIAEDVWSKK